MANLAKQVTGTLPWYREISADSWRVLRFSGLAWTFDVYDSFMLSLTIPALTVAFQLTKADAGAIGSILAAGLIVGGHRLRLDRRPHRPGALAADLRV